MAKNALFDIGGNLIDDMFAGVYLGKLVHESIFLHFPLNLHLKDDIDKILMRAKISGLRLLTSTTLEDLLTT